MKTLDKKVNRSRSKKQDKNEQPEKLKSNIQYEDHDHDNIKWELEALEKKQEDRMK